MKLNKMQKYNHDQARMIPESIWQDGSLFHKQLPSDFIPLMTASDEHLLSFVQAAAPKIRSRSEKQCAWLAIAFSHPHLTGENLIELAQTLQLSDILLFNTAALAGKVSILQVLEQKYQGTSWIKARIFSEGYALFKKAARHGQLAVIHYLESRAPKQREQIIVPVEDAKLGLTTHARSVLLDTTQEMISADDFYAFRWAAFYGYKDILQYLEDKAPELFDEMIMAKEYQGFSQACLNGHEDVALYLVRKVSDDQLQAMIKEKNYEAIKNVAKSGSLDLLQSLEASALASNLPLIIEKLRDELFINAAAGGNVKFLEYLALKFPKALPEMIAADHYGAFREAVVHGHLDVLRYLESKVLPNEMYSMLRVNNFSSFTVAAYSGNFDLLKYFENICRANHKTWKKMIMADDFRAFRRACGAGQIDVLIYLEKFLSAHELQMMIQAKSYESYLNAAEGGHLQVLLYLEEKYQGKIKDMIAAQDFGAFRLSGSHHYVEVLKHLEAMWPNALQKMINAGQYAAFNSDANVKQSEHAQIEKMEYLASKAPKKLKKMIAHRVWSLVMDAMLESKPGIVRFLASHVEPALMQSVIKGCVTWASAIHNLELVQELLKQLSVEVTLPRSFNPLKKRSRAMDLESQKRSEVSYQSELFKVFKIAVFFGNFEVTHALLQTPKVFQEADNDSEAYRDHLNFFIDEKLAALRHAVYAADKHNEVPFDFDKPEETMLHFLILKNLLTRKDSALQEDIQTLLQVPTLKTFIQNNMHDHPEEIVLLALRGNNEEAAKSLAAILNLSLETIRKQYGIERDLDLGIKTAVKGKPLPVITQPAVNFDRILEIEETHVNPRQTTLEIKQLPRITFFKPSRIESLDSNARLDIEEEEIGNIDRSASHN